MFCRKFPFIILLFVFLVSGCQPGTSDIYKSFEDEDPLVRALAARQAGALKDERAIPYLVDRLSDAEPEVRFFSIISLEKITGKKMGYNYYDPPEQRQKAVDRWRNWLKTQSIKMPSTKPAGSKDEF